jgi:Leucine-rich repeat (LRR) protein
VWVEYDFRARLAISQNLKSLDVEAKNLPEEIGMLTNLERLKLNHVESLPFSIEALKNLKRLECNWCFERPSNHAIGVELSSLEVLEVTGFHVEQRLTQHITLDKLINLREIKYTTWFPEEIGNLTNLEFIELVTSWSALPSTIFNLKKLEALHPGVRSFEIANSEITWKLLASCPRLGCL